MNKNMTVLVVEDDSTTVGLLRQVFLKTGLRFVSASSVVGALELARIERPNIILMDVNLTDGDGLEAVRVLKADRETAGIPIIAVSGMDPEELRVKAEAGGCSDYLAKPFRIYDLAFRVQRWLPGALSA
jgi:CheY-like chemotaxis protein